ncbi:MAG: ABC transporter ATP-binding protein [Mycobacteriaceae bacterium]
MMVTTKLSSAISIRSAKKYYQSGLDTVHAVDNISLSVQPGQFVALYGASGSGKTTLVNLLAGLDVCDSGDITVADLPVSSLNADQRAKMRREVVGVVFQEHNLIEEFTVLENVILPVVTGGSSRKATSPLAIEVLAKVGLAGLEQRFPRQLSGGQRQRVGVARALLGDRKVLLADEPTGALDSQNSMSLFGLFRTLAESGVAVVVATHDPLAKKYADRVLEMVDGKIVDGL